MVTELKQCEINAVFGGKLSGYTSVRMFFTFCVSLGVVWYCGNWQQKKTTSEKVGYFLANTVPFVVATFLNDLLFSDIKIRHHQHMQTDSWLKVLFKPGDLNLY